MLKLNLKSLTAPLLYLLSIVYLIAAVERYLKVPFTDFSVFWAAGQSVSAGNTSYVELSPTLPYLNGPSLSAFLSLVSGMEFGSAHRIWLTLNCVFLLISILLIARKYESAYLMHSSALFALLAISYPVRMNIALGQVVSLALMLVVISFVNREARWRTWQSWASAFALTFAFELKPYLALCLIILFLLERRIVLLAQSALAVIILNILYFFLLTDSSWIDWVEAIRKRSQGLVADESQVSLPSILNNNLPLPGNLEIIIFALSVILILAITYRVWRSEDSILKFATLLTLGPILSPYSHEFDFIFSVFGLLLVLVIVIGGSKPRYLTLALFGLFLNLNGTSLLSTILVLTCFLLILYIARIVTSFKQLAMVSLLILVIQYIPHFLSENYMTIDLAQFRKTICLIIGYFCWLYIVAQRRNFSLPKNT